MIRLSLDCSESDLFDAIRRWIEKLVDEDYGEALALTYLPETRKWRPEILRAVLKGCGRPSGVQSHRVTRTEEARISDLKPRWEVIWYEDEENNLPSMEGEIAELVADLPIDGTWSDLTAVFALHQVDGYRCLQLIRVDVL